MSKQQKKTNSLTSEALADQVKDFLEAGGVVTVVSSNLDSVAPSTPVRCASRPKQFYLKEHQGNG
ncbi:hypothetical protein GZ77_26220 [Endozoicomonas montiporae]|uniref:Uncharacterized protein n=1 Tax=Endozoicomonas montiporae TaxID=1027273 RepID=A0A081MYN2_9GAMM|nr:hypothetical protein [Endozoicomonas montiporae]KEQ11242.1 hypothetical protein GZ77_26455 [Endozoicomonas montiporae]KEQ11305.1 hypothetical protein GZ77_26220 [Endozoicomonas montiporae]